MSKTKLLLGDNIQSLQKLPDNSVDSIVSDPPYGLSFMGKKWDYDVPSVEFWKEVYRVLKPGGHVLSFGGTRTYHRMVVNIEDAGFEIRDQIMWLYGSGFPKSLNISKQIDKTYICEYRKIARTAVKSLRLLQVKLNEDMDDSVPENVVILQEENQENKMVIGVVEDLSQTDISIYATTENIEANTTLLLKNILEEGLNQEKKFITLTELKTIIDLKIWNLLQKQNTRGNTPIHESVMNMGTSLKPANEPICVARKPISEKTVAENVLKWGTGGINIDGCRVGTELISHGTSKMDIRGKLGDFHTRPRIEVEDHITEGRFPANIILECICDEVIKGEMKIKMTTSGNSKSQFNDNSGLAYKDYDDKGDIHTNPMCPCYLMDEQSGTLKSGEVKPHHKKNKTANGYQGSCYGKFKNEDTSLSGYGDKGGASRFFYQAKVSKAERNMGLDGFEVEILTPTIKLLLKTDYNNKNFIWEKEDLKTKLADTDKSHQKDIEEYITTDDNKWNTEWFGNIIMDQFLMDTKSIIETKTNSTTIYQTLNLLIQKNIKKNIQELLGEMVSDINFVEDVEKKSTKVIITYQKKDGLNQSVSPVSLEEVWSISVKENKSSHPTIKPVSLMAYLCRLVTPPNGIVLDPFMGSGSTGIAARLEGFKFLGMELDEDYFKIAKSRIENFEEYRKFLKK
jgi:DNA modification methylase